MSNVASLPNFKRTTLVWERLEELAQFAKERPEKFDRFVMIVESAADKQGVRNQVRYELGHEMASTVISVLEIGKAIILAEIIK